MTRSTISPLRRLAATMATLGVIGFGAVAVAPAALADVTPVASVDASTAAPATDPAAVTPAPDVTTAPPAPEVVPTNANGQIVSPTPDKAIEIKLGALKIKLVGQAAQVYQTIEANLYAQQGYQVSFDQHGVLVIGKKICDPTKSAAWNKGCVNPGGARF